MGYIRHDAVVITTWHETEKLEAYVNEFRSKLPEGWAALVVGPIHSPVNREVTYFLAPDGSKEGWADSKRGDEMRFAFENGLKELGIYYHGVAVNFGGDNPEVVRIRIIEDRLED